MPTPATDGGLGAAAKQVAERASALARLELELAGLELKRKVAALAIGIVMALGGVVFLLFALGFGAAAGAAALETRFSHWVSLLIVTGALLAIALFLVVVGLGSLRKGTPPVPEQAIEEAKLTTQALRADGEAG